MKRILIIIAVLAALGGGGWYWWSSQHKETQRSFKTVKVDRGVIVQTVKATGLVQPVLSVLVGTQVNGPVRKLYVDYNDRVKVGDLVAQIDPTVYQARFAQDEANLHQSTASLDEANAKLTQSEKELARSKELAKRELLSQSDLDAAIASRDTLAAQVKVAEANVEQAKAALQVSKANRDYTTIRSPVDGVVIARNVDEGQTVVASMTAQTLFSIATDLKHMQVQASIPEADIGMVHTNQSVAFNVDAYELDFTGTVAQIRLAASTVQNVVTYPVIIRAENPDEKLFPGMTASISCEVGRHENALRVPNAALRFKPDNAEVPQRSGGGSRGGGSGGGGGFAGGPRSGAAGGEGGSHGGGKPKNVVWVLDPTNPVPRAVFVRVGLNDGAFTEIKEPSKLEEGADLAIGYESAESASSASATVNPFAPKMMGGSGRPR
jgi:HlyD family secretion protein